MSLKVNICQTVRLTSQTGTKVGFSEPIFLNEKGIDQRIKETAGITE